MNSTVTRPQANVWPDNLPSPIADLIDRHRTEMAEIWQRHGAELRKPGDRAA